MQGESNKNLNKIYHMTYDDFRNKYIIPKLNNEKKGFPKITKEHFKKVYKEEIYIINQIKNEIK